MPGWTRVLLSISPLKQPLVASPLRGAMPVARQSRFHGILSVRYLGSNAVVFDDGVSQ